MTVRIVIAMELPNDASILQTIQDGANTVDAPTPEQIADDWLADVAGFCTDGRYELVAIEQGDS